MAAMAPALTDAPAEARHIRLKLAAASSGLSPSSVEHNSNATNILLSSSVSQSAASSNGKRHHLPTCHEDSCRCSRNCKVQHQEALAVSKLQPLVASYLCADVAPVAKEPLKSHVLLNGSLFHSSRSGDFFLRKSLSGGQPKGLVNGTGTGGGGSAMVPVNGLATKVAVPSTALPEKGSVATVNGDNSKPLASGEALLPLSSKSGVTVPVMLVPRADNKHQRELTNVSCRAPEDTGVGGPAESQELKSEMVHPPASCLLQSTRGFSERNFVDIDLLEDPQTSISTQSDHSTAPRSSSPKLEVLLRERANRSQSRQSEISGRLRRLCKRIQVVQAKQVERHVRQQLSGFVDCALTEASSFTEVNTWRGSQGSADSWAESLGHFMKGGSVPSELEKLHLSGSTHLRMAEAGFDSDATESSSGGESDVEEEELTQVDIEQRHVKLWRRAEGRFALERASIISRWTWLQAQISDLEYRIRQHADIYRQIRASKGPVELRDTSPLGQAKVETMEHLPSQNATENRSQSSQFRSSRSMNGFLHSNMAEISDSSCTAARIRPLTNCKRRRLIQPSLVQNLSGKVQNACCAPTWLCEVNASCVMCGSSHLPTKGESYKLPLVDRVALQDPNIHPTLSLQSDLPLSVQLQRALKSHWLTRHIEEVKPLKKVSLKHKLSPFTSSSSSMLTKRKFRLPNSHMAAIKFSRHKSRSDRSRRQQADVSIRSHKLDTHVIHSPCAPERLLDRSLSRKRMREPSLVRTDTPNLLSDAMSPCSSQLNVLPADSSTPLAPSSSCSMPIRKKRSENSFDINNIVIPMSVAATTRVEKLQYKEIITPSWRTVDLFSQPLADGEEDVEVEDLSDGAFAQLHQKCEDQERSRWRWTTLAPAKRRGSRSYKSLDGRTTPSLSGTNPSTPQPSSPDTGHFHLLQDYGPVPSPLSPASPDTPCSRDSHTPHVKDPYRLTYSEDTRCSTPDCTYEERTVQPWDRRTFPLPEDPEAEPEEEAHQILPISMRTSRFRNGSESEASSP